MTPEDVVAWMLAEVMREGMVDQEFMASAIESKFGEEFIPENENGNPSIRRDVLKAFRKISDDTVVWVRSEKEWRKREAGDEPGRGQE